SRRLPAPPSEGPSRRGRAPVPGCRGTGGRHALARLPGTGGRNAPPCPTLPIGTASAKPSAGPHVVGDLLEGDLEVLQAEVSKPRGLPVDHPRAIMGMGLV